MVKKIFYNSSLPRAGSTLIQNILSQNPQIHSTPTSGIYEMLAQTRRHYTDGLEFKAQSQKEMEKGYKGFLKGGIYGFYNSITDRPYVMEKCRGWGSEFNFINEFDPNPKVICMIRDIRDIYASLEKKYRSNPLIETNIANWGNLTGTTTDKRVDVWSANPPIGPAVDRLYQILLEGLSDKILFVKFEDLCEDPKTQLERIYDYLELKEYKHDFNNIPQYTKEDDKWYGIFGDHIIRKKLKPQKSTAKQVLGENTCKRIEQHYQWFFNDFGYEI